MFYISSLFPSHESKYYSDNGRCSELKDVLVMVEIPKGSRNKYEYNLDDGRFYLDRMLFSAVHYPADYGFIPYTLAEDGDPLDALVLVGEATFPGCMIRAKPVGVFDMWDEKGPDKKILCVPVQDPQWNWVNDLTDVPEHLLHEVTHFFQVYKELERKKTKVGQWHNRESALSVIAEAIARYEQSDTKNLLLGHFLDQGDYLR